MEFVNCNLFALPRRVAKTSMFSILNICGGLRVTEGVQSSNINVVVVDKVMMVEKEADRVMDRYLRPSLRGKSYRKRLNRSF